MAQTAFDVLAARHSGLAAVLSRGTHTTSLHIDPLQWQRGGGTEPSQRASLRLSQDQDKTAKKAKNPSSSDPCGSHSQVPSQISALCNYEALAIPWVESEGNE